MTERFHLMADIPGVRLDSFASEHIGLSRTQIQRLIRENHVTVNGEIAKPGYKLQKGDKVDIFMPPPPPSALLPEQIPLAIAYEDDDLLVVDKPPGLVVHPAAGHPGRTLVNAILAHCPGLPGIDGTVRPGIVHRLDKDTSGLLIVAKNDASHASLSAQMKARSIVKRYLVLLKGKLSPERGAIEAPIGRDPRNRQRMAVVSTGRPARTSYRVLMQWKGLSLVEATLETGRTHQIRVHFAAIGFPVIGDATYGAKTPYLQRQFVHAHYLKLRLPGTGQWVEFESPLPPDLRDAVEALTGQPFESLRNTFLL